MRYVRNPNDNNVMNMRHVLFVGSRIDFTSKFEIYMKNILPKFNNDVIRFAKQHGKDW